MMAYLWLAVEFGESIITLGGTACGKTSTMNAIMLFIPPQAKIVSIEDTREINIPHENWIAGLTRSGFAGKTGAGSGEIDMFELVKAALRQRPQYVVVGEVRGKEAFSLFQAMATGHTAYSTMHADSVRSIIHRLENPPINLPRVLLSALNIVVLQSQVMLGDRMVRRINKIVEIVGLDPDTNDLITNTVYEWNPSGDKFKYLGHSVMFEKIMSKKNMTMDEINEEFKRRTEIVNWMMKKKVRSYKEVAKIVSQYYTDPGDIIKRIKAETHA
jgi:flagellar protein FlaI